MAFDETTPPSKHHHLMDDDLDEEEAIKVTEKKNLEIDIEDETLKIDKLVNIEESRNHPLENNVNYALTNESWIVAMQEELNQFISNEFWNIVPQPRNMTIIGTKWVFRNKLDENGVVSRNKARLVAQGYNQQEVIDYDETYAPVAILEYVRILLAYACALDFKLFQMDVKNAFLNSFINEEVYVAQPPGFNDFEKPNHVYKLKKALYGLKQAPKACFSMAMIDSKEAQKKLKAEICFRTTSHNKHTWFLSLQRNSEESTAGRPEEEVVQPPAYQAPAYQAPAPQIQGVSKEDFQAYVKANDAVMRNMQTQGQNMQNQLTNLTDMLSKFLTSNTASTLGTLPSNTVTNPKEDLKGITTRSGVAYKGPTIHTTSSPKAVEREPEVTKDTMPPTNNGSTEDIQPSVVPVVHHESISEPVNAPVSASRPNQKASIPFPSRRNDERRHEKANDQIEKFYEIFRDLSFEISFTDALMLMPKFASTLKTLIENKEKLSEMARTPLNENCSAVILNKLPKKLGDPGRFLIPCEFSEINTCNALADLGASINLMPYSVWKNLSLPELTPTCMTLELADRSISEPIGIAEDVYVTVGKFQFPADFVVVDFEPDPRVPLILGRSFLKTSRALIDVYEGEITLRVGREAITFNLDQTSRYTANYNHMTANRIDVIDMACEEYSQEVLGFSNVISSGNPTPYYDPIVSTTSPTLTLFGDSDFLLFEEAGSFLAIEDDPTLPEVDPTYYDPDGDILILKAILNNDPSPPPPNQGNYFPETRKDLKICEVNNENSSVNKPPEVKLKDLPPHLEYAFLEGNDKLPVIIAKDLKNEEKAALIEVLKSHKRAIAWKLSDIKGIDPEFCTHKILMEEDYEPTIQHQRRVNLKIHDIIKKEVEKLFDAGLIYPISDSSWVSPVHCVPKKGGMTVVKNDENDLIPTRLVTGWRVCIDYRKLNEATRKDHFPLPFMDQMLERLAGNQFYCFLDGFSGYFQIPIDPKDQEKTTFTCPYGTFAYRRMPFGLCNAPGTFQRCMMAIFHDMIEKTMEVFMDDFSVFGDSFSTCLSHLDKMLKRCEDTNLVLNWEKSHFMVKEGIVLGHKILFCPKA
ncbi:reverse transcriptase domain-containing protein [Tanacetum coccineum]